METLKAYLDVMTLERSWSWSLIAAAYLVLALLMRQLFFAKVLRETKQIDPGLYSSARGLYFKASLTGWLVLLVSLFLVVAQWLGWNEKLLREASRPLFCLILPSLFFLSVILHLTAYVRALLAILRQRMGVEREF